jgi:hypothetical protein
MKILNLTQHTATADQVAAGVVEPKDKKKIQEMLTFTEKPTAGEVLERAEALAAIAREEGATHAMIGGAPFLMMPLHLALYRRGIVPVYAFSVRESTEEMLPDGTVRKVQVFRHAGFISLD